ncbi:MAG TPA: twin-arginine translocase subunit TatC [Sphingomonadales bacterium]|nr:twin-arginine translocase subunit TatC [Sphingomonadales bacterium]
MSARKEKKEKEAEAAKAPLLEHLLELRTRLIYSFAFLLLAFAVTYTFADAIYDFLVAPLAEAMREHPERRMIFTGLQEAFLTKLKVAFYAALFAAFPLIAIQIWKFVAPGLYKNERRAFLPFLVATPVLFAAGGALVYYLVMPLAWRFFLGFEQPGAEGGLPIELEARVSEYLSLVITLIFAFGMSFQLPILLILLNRAGLLALETLKKGRRYAIVIAFMAAAVLTPPDVISQIALGIPLVLLYELSILAIRLMDRRREARKGA